MSGMVPPVERVLLNRRRPVCTWALLGVTGLVFLVEALFGGLSSSYPALVMGAKVNQLIDAGQLYRLVTPIFLHFGLAHVACNAYALYIWGPIVESLFGRAKFLLVYIGSGMVGVAASYCFSSAFSAGASGAIFGLLGAMLTFRKKRPVSFKRMIGPQLIVLIGINLVFGFLGQGVDNCAHLGGLAGGYLLALGAGLYGERTSPAHRALGLAGALALWVGLLALGHTGLTRFF